MRLYKYMILGLGFLAMGCGDDFFDQVVTIEVPEHTPTLAVTSSIVDTDSTIRVYVSTTIGILVNEDPEVIEDATVELFKNDVLLHTLPYKGDGFYELTEITPLGGTDAEYRLEVSAPGYETAKATERMPVAVPVESVVYEEDGAITEDGDRVDAIDVEWDDPKDVENYYLISARVNFRYPNSDLQSDRLYLGSTDPIIEDTGDRLSVRDLTFDGKRYKAPTYSYSIFFDPSELEELSLTVTLSSVSSARYFFDKSLEAYYNAEDNPFAEPATVFSNIEGGAGIFTLQSSSEKVIDLL